MSKTLNVKRIPEPTVIVAGDFNFSFIKWTREENGGCRWEEKANAGATPKRREQFENMMVETDKFNLVQIIEEETRMKNTLDLVFTNEVDMITNIDVNKSTLSDHNLVELTTNIKTEKSQNQARKNEEKKEKQGLWDLNFHSEDIKWKEINNVLGRIPWEIILKDKNTEECTKKLLQILEIICMKYIPKRKTKSKSDIPRERKKLFGRMKKLKLSKKNLKLSKIKFKSKKNLQILDTMIREIESEIIRHKKMRTK